MGQVSLPVPFFYGDGFNSARICTLTKKASAKPAAQKSSAPAKQQFWGERLTEAPEMRNIAYCAGRDVAPRPMADAVLVPFDCWQNRAHITMLSEQGVVSASQAQKIRRAVTEFEKAIAAGDLTLAPEKEDVHTNIEHYVAGKLGKEISGVMHSGRSRNDQTTTVVRMFIRDRLLDIAGSVAALIDVICRRAEEYAAVPIAGYTHYQPASVTTVGHWFASYAQALLRDLSRLVDSYDRINISPLGAAASFGTSWPINRERTAALLGFRAVQANSLDCVTNRWEMEADAASAIEFVITHLSIISQDIIMLSAPQLGIMRIADRYVTGSSIMPQKRNPDFAEVTRAKAVVVQQMAASLFGIARGAFSGYNRDTQWTKYLIMDIFAEVADAPAIFAGVFDTLSIDESAAEASAAANFVNAVDVADVLAQESGLPFRTTYEIASKAVRLSENRGSVDPEIVRQLAAEAGSRELKLDIGTPAAIAERKKHTGGTQPRRVKSDIKMLRRELQKQSSRLAGERARLDKLAKELMS
jgi:argininosuccinate lyase